QGDGAMTAAVGARAAAAVAVAAGLLASARAGAEVERYAVLFGDNRGAADEGPLRYAESDAAKMARVLRELGGFPAENLLLLQGESAPAVQRALIAMNDRIRTRAAASARVLLLVYYSGHADAAALHLAGSELELAQLQQLVRGSAAAVRL